MSYIYPFGMVPVIEGGERFYRLPLTGGLVPDSMVDGPDWRTLAELADVEAEEGNP